MPAVTRGAVVTKTLLDGTVIVESPRGHARMSRLRPGVLLCVCSGFFSAQFYEPMVAVAQHEITLNGSAVMLVDGWELDSIDTGFREKWTEWFKANRQNFRMTLLVRTKLMEMAASLANLFTGIRLIATYSSVVAWERAASADVPGFSRTTKPAA